MNPTFIDRRRVRQGLTLLFLTGAVVCMFPPWYPPFMWWAQQAPFVACGYLLAGLIFLVVGRTRLMFVCFGCSAAISFFFNEADAAGRHGSPGPPSDAVGWYSASPTSRLFHPQKLTFHELASSCA